MRRCQGYLINTGYKYLGNGDAAIPIRSKPILTMPLLDGATKMPDRYSEPYLPLPGGPLDGNSIEASNQTLLRQAPMTADEYLHSAIDHIDDRLGKGYAKQHPELIAAFMQTSAIDLGTAVIARAIETFSERLASAITETQEALRSDHPLQGETFDGLVTGLQAVAAAIDGKGERE